MTSKVQMNAGIEWQTNRDPDVKGGFEEHAVAFASQGRSAGRLERESLPFE